MSEAMKGQPLTWALWLLERWLRDSDGDLTVGDVVGDTRAFVAEVEPMPVPRDEIRVCAEMVMSEFPTSSPLYGAAETVRGWLLVTLEDP